MQLPLASTVLLPMLLMLSAPCIQDPVRPSPPKISTPPDTPAAQVTLTMPNDPKAILDVAAKVNGLSGPISQPWHLRVSYQIFDNEGQPQDSGVYEELWVSDKKYKRSYSSPKFTQTDFATDRGLYRTGNQNWPGLEETMVRTELIEPIPVGLNFSGFRIETNRRSIDKIDLQCVTLKADWIFLNNDAYCFQAGKPMLRITNAGNSRGGTLYNNVVMFQGHFLARDIRVTNQGKPRLVLHIDTIEGEPTVNDSDFAPPPDAVRIPDGKVVIPGGTMQVFLLRHVPPHYPSAAKASGISGTVELRVTIGKDGRIKNAVAIGGPFELRRASSDAVLKWEYRPFLIASEPTEVETTLEIVFTLAG